MKNGPDARPPRLFGAYDRMPLLIAMLNNGGYIRRADLMERTGKSPIDELSISDKSGLLLERWEYRRKRYMTAFNPSFPLLAEVCALLDVLSRHYPTPLADVVPESERVLPRPIKKRAHNVDYLFGSILRTHTLAALEALDGDTPQTALHRSVPRQPYASVKNVVAYFVEEGVLEKCDGRIRFKLQPWLPRLRTLLQAYLALRPDLHDKIKEKAPHRQSPHQGFPKLDLIASPPVQRCLIALAVHGPLPPMRLFALAGVVTANGTLEVFRAEGIVVIKNAHRSRIISLNAAYPVYAQLRSLLLRIGGVEDITKGSSDLRERRVDFSPRRIFSSELRTELLIVLNAATNDAMSASVLRRLLPEYDRANIRQALQKFETQHIVSSRFDKNSRVFVLNHKYPYWRDLKVLLDAVCDEWPSYRTIAKISDRLVSRPKLTAMTLRHG